MLPIITAKGFFLSLMGLFSALLLLLVFHYYTVVWHIESYEIFGNYIMFFMPANILFLLLFHLLFLRKLNYTGASFFTEFLVTGYSPAKFVQLKKGSGIFMRVFSDWKTFQRNYSSFRSDLKKNNILLYPFDFKNLLIGYCTARNDMDSSVSGRYFSGYISTYPGAFLGIKVFFLILKLLISLALMTFAVFLVFEYIPNFLHIPDSRTIYSIAGVILGYSSYGFLFHPFINHLEITMTLKFLQDKKLPSHLKLAREGAL